MNTTVPPGTPDHAGGARTEEDRTGWGHSDGGDAAPGGPRRSSGYRQGELLAWARRRLRGCEGADPAQEARILLEWALGVDSLWAAPDPVGARAAERFRTGVARRRHHTPLQHIVGRMWFRGLTLRARPGVFVVRPETESVAGEAIEAARAVRGHEPVVVDLCTGSGAIALAVATEVPGARVVAVELAPEALALARENIAALAPGAVELVAGDATSALADMDGTVDVVVSNPPYVPSAEVPTQEEALADPETALYGGGEDGMVVPRGIVNRAAALLRPGGVVVVEHAESQSSQMRAVATAAGLVGAETLVDLSGRDRMLRARAALVGLPPTEPADDDPSTPGARRAPSTSTPRAHQRAHRQAVPATCENGGVSAPRNIDCTHGLPARDLATVVADVRAGRLVVLPTDTVYGIGADAHDPAAVAAVLAAKGRGRQMPPPVLVADTDTVDHLCVDVPDTARRLAAAHWPGGLTLILTARPDLGWDLGETGGTLALRMPDHPVVLELLRATGPLAVTSANLTGRPPATDVAAARGAFGDLVADYLDGGPTPGSTPSTIIDLAHGRPRAIRLGTIPLAVLSADAGEEILPPA